MAFDFIDLEYWERREHYEHFIKEIACGYSMTVHLDITNLAGYRLYPAMIWLLTDTVNRFPEFRTALTAEGLGIYDKMHPAYTILTGRKRPSPVYGRRLKKTIFLFYRPTKLILPPMLLPPAMRRSRAGLPILSIYP